jgi:integrase
MNIRKRGASWQVDGIHCGRRIRKQFKSAAEAEAFVKGGVDKQADAGDRTIGALYQHVCAARWVSHKSESMTGLGGRIVNWFGADFDVRKIDQAKIHEMVRALKMEGKKNSTINRWRAGLSVMLGHAVELGWIERRPEVKSLREPKGRDRYLTKEEEEELFGHIHKVNPRLEILMVVLIDTGLRLSEAIGLRWRDISQKQITVKDTKNGEARTVPLTTRAWQGLNTLSRDANPFAFTDRYRASKVFRRCRSLTSMAGDKDVVVHTLRHTCASRMVQRGAPVAVVSHWLGHKSLTMTMRYSHLRPDQLHDWVHVLEDAG